MLKPITKNVLAYVGLISLVFTLLGAIEPFFQILDAAKFLVEKWHALTHAIWSGIFSLFGLPVGIIATSMMNADAAVLALKVSSMMSMRGITYFLSKDGIKFSYDLLCWFCGLLIVVTFVLVLSSSLKRQDPHYFFPDFDERFAPTQKMSKFEAELEEFDMSPEKFTPEQVEYVQNADGVLEWFRRGKEVGAIKPIHVTFAISLISGLIMWIFLPVINPIAFLLRLLQAVSVIMAVVLVAHFAPYATAWRDWISGVFKSLQ
jgi:hypothetical protein